MSTPTSTPQAPGHADEQQVIAAARALHDYYRREGHIDPQQTWDSANRDWYTTLARVALDAVQP